MTSIEPAMETAEHIEEQGSTFRSQPAAYAHPRRVVHAFGGLITERVASQLLEDERFRDRVSILLTETYALPADDDAGELSEAGNRLAVASGTDLMIMARRFGAVYWARAIAGVIQSSAVVTLKQSLGDEIYTAALAHRDLAGPDRVLPEHETIETATTAAGLRCIAAWCSAQPAWVAQRIRLKFPDGTELDEPVAAPFDEVGPPIINRVAS
jgi:hypothetical protein